MYQRLNMPDQGEKRVPFISIIVLTFNSEKTIKLCLDSLFKMLYPRNKFEVSIIDNGSSDSTLEIVGGYPAKVYVKPNANISELRNFGADNAHGELLGFVDSDCQIDRDWPGCALTHMADPGVGIVGCNYDVPDNAHWIEKAWSKSGIERTRDVSFVPAGNMIVRRKAFEKTKGFNERLETGEDTDLCRRVRMAGYKVASDPRVKSIHWGNPKTLIGFVKKEIWYGKGMIRIVTERDFSNKVFILTNAYILAHVAMLAVIFLPITLGSKLAIAATSFLGIILINALSALHRCMKSGCYRFFFNLVVLWYFYFLGRALCMINIYWTLLLRKDRTTTSH